MTASLLGAGLLALVSAAACVRLGLWWRRAPRIERGAPWRLGLLLAAQPLMAMLLHRAVFPPAGPGGGSEALVIAVQGAPRLIGSRGGERRVTLPEAPAGVGGEAAPDLATALRRHPGVGRLRVVGLGLAPRDREAAARLALAFDPAPLPRGLLDLHAPPPVAPGAAFSTQGRVNGVPGGSVELLDPAGRPVDARPLPASGEFELEGGAREPGPALFSVRVRDRTHGEVETVDLPVWTAAEPAPKVLSLAGAPGPEVKALRRWAADAGVDLRSVVAAGGGLELGDPRPPLTAATLDGLDLVVVDERSWGALSGPDRAALATAVRGGLGLLMRVTGPPSPATREQWRALGAPLSDGEATAPVRLPSPAPAADRPSPPELTRRGSDAPEAGSTSLLQDAAGVVLGRWRPQGDGRVGVWTVTDSSGLVTSGFGARYGELWSGLFATLARPNGAAAVALSPWAREGRRMTLCGALDHAVVFDPSNVAAGLVAEASGCAGFWPATSGWHVLHTSGPQGSSPQDQPFYVWPARQAAGVDAQEARLATASLATGSVSRVGADGPRHGPAPARAWLLAWVTTACAAWALERTRWGRARVPADTEVG